VCGTDGVTYLNECEMRLASCQKQQFIVIQSEGSCGTSLIKLISLYRFIKCENVVHVSLSVMHSVTLH